MSKTNSRLSKEENWDRLFKLYIRAIDKVAREREEYYLANRLLTEQLNDARFLNNSLTKKVEGLERQLEQASRLVR